MIEIGRAFKRFGPRKNVFHNFKILQKCLENHWDQFVWPYKISRTFQFNFAAWKWMDSPCTFLHTSFLLTIKIWHNFVAEYAIKFTAHVYTKHHLTASKKKRRRCNRCFFIYISFRLGRYTNISIRPNHSSRCLVLSKRKLIKILSNDMCQITQSAIGWKCHENSGRDFIRYTFFSQSIVHVTYVSLFECHTNPRRILSSNNEQKKRGKFIFLNSAGNARTQHYLNIFAVFIWVVWVLSSKCWIDRYFW